MTKAKITTKSFAKVVIKNALNKRTYAIFAMTDDVLEYLRRDGICGVELDALGVTHEPVTVVLISGPTHEAVMDKIARVSPEAHGLSFDPPGGVPPKRQN